MAIGTSDYDAADFYDPEEAEPQIVHATSRKCPACGTVSTVAELFEAAVKHHIGKAMPQFVEQTVSVSCACEGPLPPLTAWFWRHPEGE